VQGLAGRLLRTADSDSIPGKTPAASSPARGRRWLLVGLGAAAIAGGIGTAVLLDEEAAVNVDAAPVVLDAAQVVLDAAQPPVDASPVAVDARRPDSTPPVRDAGPIQRPPRRRPAAAAPPARIESIDAGPPHPVTPRIGDDSLDPFDEGSRGQR
jgi:hypothetical protein